MAAENNLEKLHSLIEDLETAMFTTRRDDGRLVSRPMATQKRASGADLWFVTMRGTDKLDEVRFDPHVNLAYYKDRTREWISVSGLAKVSQDRSIIHKLYARDWKAWFPEEGDPRHGTPDDPRMVLIGVDVHSAVFFDVTKPAPIALFEIAKGIVTGKEPDLGKMHHVRPGNA